MKEGDDSIPFVIVILALIALSCVAYVKGRQMDFEKRAVEVSAVVASKRQELVRRRFAVRSENRQCVTVQFYDKSGVRHSLETQVKNPQTYAELQPNYRVMIRYDPRNPEHFRLSKD